MPSRPVDPNIVTCPSCASDKVHLERVSVYQGPRFWQIEREDAALYKNDPPYGRGSSVRVWMWCEDGHTFSVQYTFHKGSVRSDQAIGEDYNLSEPPGELWRD